jgi:hypothetical protein
LGVEEALNRMGVQGFVDSPAGSGDRPSTVAAEFVDFKYLKFLTWIQ